MARSPRVKYPQRVDRTLFHTSKESLRGRYRKLTEAQLNKLFSWAHREPAL